MKLKITVTADQDNIADFNCNAQDGGIGIEFSENHAELIIAILRDCADAMEVEIDSYAQDAMKH